MEPARVELVARLEEAADRNADCWIYVSADRRTRRPVNAAGFWPSGADALLAAATDDDAEMDHYAVPLFVTNPLPG